MIARNGDDLSRLVLWWYGVNEKKMYRHGVKESRPWSDMEDKKFDILFTFQLIVILVS